MLAAFCDGVGIEHDGKGTVSGELPDSIDSTKIDATIDKMVEQFDPKLITLYLYCFNMQKENGWDSISNKLESDDRLTLA